MAPNYTYTLIKIMKLIIQSTKMLDKFVNYVKYYFTII